MNHTILIVEDEHALQDALVKKLGHEGYTVVAAKNGEEGLTLALEQHPHLIFLDILMPHMDGLEMLRRLRQDPWGKDAHVIMLTNLENTDSVSAAAQGGSFEYLIKSDWSLEDLVEKVKTYFAA